MKGTKKGAITDFDGNFKYLIQSNNMKSVVLEFSYLGFETKEITLGNESYFVSLFSRRPLLV